ncbi:S9 family peptidase [Sorangium sp. So ce176]|uniref:S9 family peptidase n=1 Tax=Sorangium sp. So ce176 TaxID=3133286 RepID=UPI003F61164D
MTTTPFPYGSWRSPVSSQLIAAGSTSLANVMVDSGDIYWVEGRAREGGRNVLVRRGADGQAVDVTPPPFNVRTRVHEYGGGAATVHRGTVYFSNFADQRLYRQRPGEAPEPLTPEGDLRYADGLVDAARNAWIGVREDHSAGDAAPVNTLVAIDLATGGPGRVLAGGNDFYSSPRLSPDGRHIAFLTWCHPNMPWIGNELWVAEIGADGALAKATRVAGGPEESIFQPEWSTEGVLHFVSDRSGWWNLYRYDRGESVALCPKDAEFGRAQWSFGLSTYAFLSSGRLVCTYTELGVDRLALLDPASGALAPIELPLTEYGDVRAYGGRVVCLAGSPTLPHSVLLVDPVAAESVTLRTSTEIADDPGLRRYFSMPEMVAFPTEGGETAYGFYYPPFNPDYPVSPGEEEKPPLLVLCHGGPTSAASTSLNLRIQYWTSRGVAVLDVNYGGSTGYGRAYRDRLNRRWGIVDVDDSVNGARSLVMRGEVDGRRVVIAGGSAGGYTTLMALATRGLFAGGASYYGVSDAEALVRDTHKFESHYLDSLIGPYPAERATYRERSPIEHADGIDVPVIFFQGDEDRVVPPNQAEMLVEALRSKRIPVGYLLFSGEQHGFRQASNIQRSLDAELYFYAATVFGVKLTF